MKKRFGGSRKIWTQARIALAAMLFSSTYPLSAQLIPFPVMAGEEGNLFRLLVRNEGQAGIHAAMQPLTYLDVAALLDSNLAQGQQEDYIAWQVDRLAAARLGREPRVGSYSGDSDERGWLRRTFYKTRGYALDLQKPGFRLLVNPVLDIVNGRQSDGGGYHFLNTRGLQIWGEVDERVWFQTSIYENQARFPSYDRAWRSAYRGHPPGVGFWKPYETLLYDLPDAVDFFQATGEVGFRLTRHIGLRAGHGNPRLGVGQRSLLLSDFADPYLYAQIDTRVWRLHYRNLYTQLQDPIFGSQSTTRKHMVAHTLSIQLNPRWEVGLMEQTVFRRDNGFDAQYLNPVILYRAVEQDNGSPDNALIGLHTNFTQWGSLFYTQFLLDEFKFDELILNGDSWWANKWAWQVGLRSYDPFGFDGLDFGAEYNVVRPFTYGHGPEGISYTHYLQPLAHPWGASLRELRLSATQRIGEHWRLHAQQVLLAMDNPNSNILPNLGSNPLIDFSLRDRDYGYRINDSRPTQQQLSTLSIQWQPLPGASVEARYQYYRSDISSPTVAQHGLSLGLRLNAVRREGVW